MKKIIFVLLTLVVVQSSHAACAGIRCNGKITTLYMPDAEKIYVGSDGDESSLDCTPVENVYVTVLRNHINFKEIYSALLASQFSGQPVNLRIRVGSEGCEIAYVSVHR